MATARNTGIREAFFASRPISWINTAAPFFLASILSGQSAIVTFIGTLYFLFPYNVMLYGINDIFDYESDIKNPRKGLTSVEGSIVAKAGHRRLWWWIAITNVPFIAFFMSVGSVDSKIWFLFLFFMAIAYSMKWLRFKEIPLIDSFTSSTHFYSPFVYGLLLAGSATFYTPALIAFILWGMASHAYGAIQDIKYDREAGIGSIGTVFGMRFTLIFCLSLYTAAALFPAYAYGILGLSSALGLLLYALNVVGFLWLKDEARAPETNRGWKNFLWLNIVVGFWITQMLILAYNPFKLTGSMLTTISYILIGVGAALAVRSTTRIYKTTIGYREKIAS